METLNRSADDAKSAGAWLARLELEFAGSESSTRLVHRAHEGPLRVQRPFYPEDDGTCHVYLLHPPGGIVGGDQLRINVATRSRAHAVLTSPAATKLYRSDGRISEVRQTLRVNGESLLEWLPQETIVFSGARAETTTKVELDATSQFVGWEVACLGRPAARESFGVGTFRQNVEIWRGDLPLYLERAQFGEGTETGKAAWGLSGAPVIGTMWVATDRGGVVNLVRQCLDVARLDGARAGATDLDGVTLLRYVGPSVQDCWALFVSAWRATRPILSGTSASAPRIWSC